MDVGGGSCRKHGGGRRCVAEGCMKTDVGGESLLYRDIERAGIRRWFTVRTGFLWRLSVKREDSFLRCKSPLQS